MDIENNNNITHQIPILEENEDDDDEDVIYDKIYIDEELPEIEYYEILTFDEIIKDNPTFVAFTKKEIYNELYEVFDNANKTNNFVDLFYSIVDEEKINTNNYVLICDSIKKKFNENDDKKDPEQGLREFIDSFKRINKFKDLDLAKKEKNKLFFTIIYDERSRLVRFKPVNKTKIKIDNKENDYILLKDDDTNIPVDQIYYSVPKCSKKDYLSDKVLSYLNKNIDLEKKNTEVIENNNIENELNKVKPKIENILKELDIEELKKVEELDYSSLEILLDKFDYNLDKMNLNDVEILNKYISDIFSDCKEEKINLKSFRIKLLNIVNNKTLFYEKNINILKLLKFSDKDKEENDIIINKLEEERNSIENPELLYNNINDITNAIYNNDVDEKAIIENIRNIMNYQKIDNLIKTIKDYNRNDVEKIEELYFIEKKKYELMRNFSYNLYQPPLKFLDFSNELYEIKIGNDNSRYNINNNNDDIDQFIDYDNKDDLDDMNEIDNLDLNYFNYNINIFDKYIQSPNFRHAEGFKEYLKIILPIIDKIQNKSKLEIDYNILCNNLYKKFNNLPTKFFILKNKIHEYDNTISDKIINDICNINTKIFTTDSNSIKNIKLQIKLQINQYIDTNIDKILESLIEFNEQHISVIKNLINHALAIWILEIQNSIINGTHVHNYNLNYIHLWSDIGYPLVKNKKIGVTIYLCDISNSIFQENEEINIYNIDKNIIDIVTKIIETEYKDILTELEKNSTDLKSNLINRNKGKKYQVDLVENLNEFKKTKTVSLKDKMLANYVNALIYMPGINYNRIHKYLLGCCLQQINKDFSPDSDLIGKRNDLLAAKTYFAKNRENNKPREYSFIPFKEKELDENIDDNIDDYYKYTKLNYDIFYSSENFNYDMWLNSFNDDKQNRLFTENNYINIYKNGSSEYIKIITKYLEYFINTINNNKSTIITHFINNINNINYKQVIYNSLYILSKSFYSLDDSDANYETDYNILDDSIKYIKYLISEFNNLNKITDNKDLTDIQRAKAYICVKAMCCPYNPDHIIGDKMKLYIDTDDNNKYIDKIKIIHKKTMNLLNYSKIPTFKENQDFLNKMREEFKNRKLDVFDKQTEEQRKVFNELTKIGIRVENLDNNIFNDDQDVNPDIPIYNGEDEFRINTDNNDDNDPDDLDHEDHGFIYSQ